MKPMRWSLFPAVVAIAVSASLAAAEPTRVAVSDGDFDRPHDLVLSSDGRFLYVADLGNDAVKVLDPASLKTVGVIGAGELDSPHDVAFDDADRLLVADSGDDAIAVYRVDGADAERLETWTGEMFSPEGVAPVGGGRVFVTDTGGETFSFRGFLKVVVPGLMNETPHRMGTLTNLSAPPRVLKDFAKQTFGRLSIVSASLHLEHTDTASFLSRLSARRSRRGSGLPPAGIFAEGKDRIVGRWIIARRLRRGAQGGG